MTSAMRKIGFTLCCLLGFVLAGCSTMSPTEGTYSGTIYSAGIVPVFTTFYPEALDEGGQMNGTFMYKENSYWVTGALSRCKFKEDRQVQCQWQDKHGSGIMEVRFSENYDAFEGTWGTYCGTRPDLIWNGKRVRSGTADNAQ